MAAKLCDRERGQLGWLWGEYEALSCTATGQFVDNLHLMVAVGGGFRD